MRCHIMRIGHTHLNSAREREEQDPQQHAIVLKVNVVDDKQPRAADH